MEINNDGFHQAFFKYGLFLLFAFPIVVFILLPILSVLIESFRSEDGFTLINYKEFFLKRYYYGALLNSLMLAVITSSIVVVVATIFALFMTKTTSALRFPLKIMIMLPFIAPPYLFSLSLIVLFGRRGILAALLGIRPDIYGWPGIIIAQVAGFIPLAYILIENVLISIDPTLEDAAYDIGASQSKTLFKVTLPLAIPGLLKAFLLVFIWSMADFANPALIGKGLSLLAPDAYLLIVGENNTSMASVLCIFLVLPSLCIFVVHKYLFMGRSYTTISGKPQSSESQRMGPYLRVPIMAICIAISLFIMINISLVFFTAFVKVPVFNNTFTLEHTFVSGRVEEVLLTSLKMAISASLIGSALSACLAYVISRRSFPFTNILEFISLMGFSVPGTVMGIGYILIFNQVPYLTGTVLLLSLNTAFRVLSVGVEAGTSKLEQVDISLEEAASDVGASKISTILRIVFPLMKSSFFGSLIFIFLEGMVTVSAVIFLVSPGTDLASLKILSFVEHGHAGPGCGVAVLLIITVVIAISIFNLLTRRTYKL